MRKKMLSLGLVASLMIGSLVSPVKAGSEGRKNTTITLGAGTIYAAAKKKKTVAIVGAVGTAYAYKRYSNQKKREQARAKAKEARRKQWYKNRYGKNWKRYCR